MTNPIIEAHGLTKRFPDHPKKAAKKPPVAAVTDLSFEVADGELVAFLGPNGAGKSTSLRMLTTLLPPTSGSARVVGRDVVASPPKCGPASAMSGSSPAEVSPSGSATNSSARAPSMV